MNKEDEKKVMNSYESLIGILEAVENELFDIRNSAFASDASTSIAEHISECCSNIEALLGIE